MEIPQHHVPDAVELEGGLSQYPNWLYAFHILEVRSRLF